MNERKKLGKISKASFGIGGYDDAMIGLSLTFSMDGTCVGTFEGAWSIRRQKDAKWTEDDRLRQIGEAGMKLAEMLGKIRRKDVGDLVGTPVEVTLEGNQLKSWRLLDEVL